MYQLTLYIIQEVLDAAEEKKNDLKQFVSALVEKIDNNRNVMETETEVMGQKINGMKENSSH